jgi:Kef-type K+ transport system membrane component KefB
VFLWIRSAGHSLIAPVQVIEGQLTKRAPGEPAGALTHVLLALVVIILCARALGALLRQFNQPPVVGEMIAGILLGPSLLGRVLPSISAYLLPNQVAPYLSVIANLGVVLYMFLVGVELNTDLLRDRTHASVATSHAASLLLSFSESSRNSVVWLN